jgi:4'-phosphopantetheinyl transferase EntD
MKESLYKAMHPFIGQYVHFREVEIQPLANGTSHIYFQLDSGAHERFHDATVHWQRQGDFFVSSASVQLKEGDDDEIL